MNTVPNQAIAVLARAQQRVSQGLWRWCSSRGALLVFLLMLASALALSRILPQTPAHIRSDPVAYQEWTSLVQVQFKGWTYFLEAIGAFHVWDTAWFRFLLACLAFILLVSGADRVGRLLNAHAVQHPDGFYETRDGTALSSGLPMDQAADRLEQAMKKLGLHVRRHECQSRVYLYGFCRVWASLDSIAIYAGALLAVLSLAIDGRWGWQQNNIHLLPGIPVPVGDRTSQPIELVDAQGLPSQARIDVGQEQGIPLEQGKPTYRRGRYYVLTDKGGYILQVTASGVDGKALTLSEYAVRPEAKTSLSFVFDPTTAQDEPDRLFIVPDRKLVARIQWLGQDPGSEMPVRFRQWVFAQGGQDLVGEAEVEAAEGTVPTEINGTTYTWTVTGYAVIDAAYQPGRLLFWVGAALVLAGLLVQMVPRQQVWGLVVADHRPPIRICEESAGLDRRWSQQRRQAWENLSTTLENVS